MKNIVESAFMKIVLLATGGVILFFIFFTMIFSGKRHFLFDQTSGFDWSWFNLGIFLNELVVPLVIVLTGLLVWALSHFLGQKESK